MCNNMPHVTKGLNMFQTIDPITLHYLDIFLEFNNESTPKHVPKVPFWKSSILY